MITSQRPLFRISEETLKSIADCNGEIFAFLLNEPELKKWQKKKSQDVR